MPPTRELDPRRFYLAFDAPGLEPNSVRAGEVLQFAADYFALLQAVAQEDKAELYFTGLEVVRKCAALASVPSDRMLLRPSVGTSAMYLSGTRTPPRGLGVRVANAQKSFRALPKGYTVDAETAEWAERIVVAPEPELPPASLTTLRARVQRVGGVTPRATFESGSEAVPFTLRVSSEEEAKRLSHHLYEEVEIDAEVARAEDGRIVDGSVLLRFTPVESGDSVGPWLAWFRDSTAGRTVIELEEEGSSDD